MLPSPPTIQTHRADAGNPHDHVSGPVLGSTLTSTAPPPRISLSDMISAASAFGTLLAAILAFASLRQVAKLAVINQVRSARLATLQIMQSQAQSIAFATKSPEIAANRRADRISEELSRTLNFTYLQREELKDSILFGKMLEIPSEILEKNLYDIQDWSILEQEEHVAFVKMLNALEEISTSILREAIDIESVRKMYGSLILSSYREFSQFIYMKRRSYTYHYFDQFDLIVDILTEIETMKINLRAKNYLTRIKMLFGWEKILIRELSRHKDAQYFISDRVLELALSHQGRIDDHSNLRKKLSGKLEFIIEQCDSKKPISRQWHIFDPSRRNDRKAKIIVSEYQWSHDETIKIELNKKLFESSEILSMMLRCGMAEANVKSSDDVGTSSYVIIVCETSDGILPNQLSRQIIRFMKREFNLIHARPMMLCLGGEKKIMRALQDIIFGEGGRLVSIIDKADKIDCIWLF